MKTKQEINFNKAVFRLFKRKYPQYFNFHYDFKYEYEIKHTLFYYSYELNIHAFLVCREFKKAMPRFHKFLKGVSKL